MRTLEHTTTSVWFFRHFNLSQFERAVCVEGLYRHLQLSERRMPSLKTLHRDVTYLLQSYARIIPLEAVL